jgi:heat shock protein HslJ
MKNKTVSLLVAAFAVLLSFNVHAGAQSSYSWLDAKPMPNWNSRSRAILQTGKMPAGELARCGKFVRQPTLAADKLLAKYGWTLVGPAQVYGKTTIVSWAQGFDGMCRPRSFQTMVFVGNRVAGTLSPAPMDSRTDGSLVNVKMTSETTLTAEYVRYRTSDALCCPYKTEAVTFIIKPDGANFLLVPETKIQSGLVENQASGGDLKNTVWRWQSSTSATETMTVEKPQNYQIEFRADGKIGVKADCNTGGGSYTTEDNNISFARIFTTKMFCGERSLDARFLRGLERARSFRVEGNNLFIGAEGENGTMKFFKVVRQN